MLIQEDLVVPSLGERSFPSPLALSTRAGDGIADYVHDRACVSYEVEFNAAPLTPSSLYFEKAGPRKEIYFDPAKTRAAIVTCGGLCPGINNVIRATVLELHHRYGIRETLGIRYGYQGLTARGLPPVTLGPDEVRSIHKMGGSILGLSRGKQSAAEMVDTLVARGIDILFCVGGDGTLKGAGALYEEITKRKLPIGIVGIPKTIDNDIPYVDKSFGYETAVETARLAIDAAHTEAIGARNGVGIVKLMGRDAGFIAAAATMASVDVNYCLVPEIQFDMEGPRGLLAALEKRLEARSHAVIVVAEGCGLSLANANARAERDASGNMRYATAGSDIGPFLRDAITAHFQAAGRDINVKYIDPSYMIRSGSANANDSIFCDGVGRSAVHAAMAGKTGIVIGRWYRVFTHVPLRILPNEKKRIDPDGALWLAVSETTAQPRLSNTERYPEDRKSLSPGWSLPPT